jgi:hypothetical protein
MKLEPKDLKPASYNPRIMDDSTKLALRKSLEEFSDISGITWNKRTGNIVTGHHRWENILNIYGEDNIVFKLLKSSSTNKLEPRLAITTKDGEDTGFVVKVVDWSEEKEKAANVAANNYNLAGKFTDGLVDVLMDISSYFDSSLFTDLRFDKIEIPAIDIDFGNDKTTTTVRSHEREIGGVDNPEDEWVGMPEFDLSNAQEPHQSIKIHFKCEDDVKAFAKLIGQNITDKTKYLWFPKREVTTGVVYE